MKKLIIITSVIFAALMSACTPTHWGNYQSGEEKYQTIKLADGLYAFEYAKERSLFMIGNNSVLITDPLGPVAAKRYKEEVAKITDKPITTMVYSSSFVNRIGGSKYFSVDDIVTQQGCADNLAATPFPTVATPTKTYDKSTIVTLDDTHSLELYYFGQSYGTCLSVMIARPSNIMMAAGVVTTAKDGRVIGTVPPDPTIANYYLHNMLPFFNEIEQLAAVKGVSQMVGSDIYEGAPALGPVELIAAQKEFWETFFSTIETLYKRRVPANVIPKRADMTVFEKFDDYEKARVQTMMRRGYSLFRIGR